MKHEFIVETEGLAKRFWGEDQYSVRGIGLRIEKGCFYTLLGANGAGKTTTLKLLLGIHAPTNGKAKVFGRDSTTLESNDFRRIGYISETQKIDNKKSLRQLIDFYKPQYPNWDDAFCDKMVTQFELPMNKKLKVFSRGMLLKAKQVLALAYHPDLLIMDEPFSGLDAVIRKDSIESILDWAQDGDRTLVLSSHDIDEVEPISERVGILESGKLVLDEEIEVLKRRTRKVQFVTEAVLNPSLDLPESWIRFELAGRVGGFVDTNFSDEETSRSIKERFPDACQFDFAMMSLKDIYVSLARRDKKEISA